MTVPRDTDTRIAAFLEEGPHEMSPRLIAAIRDEVHATQRPMLRLPWRARPLSRALTVTTAMAALIVVGVVLFDEGWQVPSGAASPPPAASAVVVASPSAAAASPTPYPLADGEEWIAYKSPDGFVELIRPDGSGRHRLLSNGDTRQDTPDWSPDGSQLVFSRDNGSGSSIWIANADGSGVRALTPDIERCDPCLLQEWTRWSPDGRSIAFINRLIDRSRILRNDLAIVDVASGVVRTVLSSETQSFSHPSWSPDGSRIVLSVATFRTLATAGREGNPAQAVELAIVDPGAAEPTLVPIPGLPALPGDPAWSPDGTTIAFQSERSAIWAVSPDGGGLTELYRSASGSGELFSIAWSPDGRAVLYAGGSSGSEPALRTLDPATGRVTSATGGSETDGWVPRVRPAP